MKYCKRCGTLYQKGAICSDCKKPLVKEIDNNEPVYIISAYGFERSRIVAALEDNNIPCIEKKAKKENSSEDLTGKANNKVRISVPYCAYEQAVDILIGIGAIKTDSQIIDDDTDISTLDIEENHTPQNEEKTYTIDRNNKNNEEEDSEEMSPKKRLAVRIISALAFILLAALAIFSVDFIAELITKLFNGGN